MVTGQVGLVLAADNETVTEAGYTALITELTPLVTELGSKHATELLSDVTSEVTAATTLTGPVSAVALALTPAGYPGNASEIKTVERQYPEKLPTIWPSPRMTSRRSRKSP